MEEDRKRSKLVDDFLAHGGKIGFSGHRIFSISAVDLVDFGMPIAIISGYLRDRIFPQRFCPSNANNVGTIVVVSSLIGGAEPRLGSARRKLG